MKYTYKTEMYDGTKEIVVKIGDNAIEYVNKGYKVCVPDGLCINAHTGVVVKQ